MDKREKIRRGIMLGLAGLMALILVFGKNEKEDKMETTKVENHTPAPVGTGTAIISAPQPTPTPEYAIYSHGLANGGKRFMTEPPLAVSVVGSAVWQIFTLQ